MTTFDALGDHYRVAHAAGFPAFVTSIDDSTPLNATPYVVSLTQFAAGDWSGLRRVLVDALIAAIDALAQWQVRAELILVGGSFLDAATVPRDLDCTIFYTRDGDARADLAAWQRAQRAHGLDVRLMPLHADPVIVLKTAIYFGVLYTRGRGPHPQMRGLVLIDGSK